MLMHDESQWADDYVHDQEHDLDWLGAKLGEQIVCGQTITRYADRPDGRIVFHINNCSYGTEAGAVLHAALSAAGGDINAVVRLVPVLIAGVGAAEDK